MIEVIYDCVYAFFDDQIKPVVDYEKDFIY